MGWPPSVENEQALHVNCVYRCSPCCPPQGSFSCPWEAQPESLGSSWLIVRKEMRGRERESGIPRLWAPEEPWQTLARWQRSWKREVCQLLPATEGYEQFSETRLHQSNLTVLSLTSFWAPSWAQSCCLSGRNFKCYTKLRGNTNTWFWWNSPQRGTGNSSEPGLGGGFWRKGNCHSSQTLNHRSWVVRNPGLPQNSQLCGELSYSLCFRLFSNLWWLHKYLEY